MPNPLYNSIIIGTGFSGLAMAIQLKSKGIHDFIILEKANEVGGTWRENTYPGAECDIPSALYSFSFEPYPYWKYKWSMQEQILAYIKHVAKKYDLYQHILFQQEMTGAHWKETEKHWIVHTKKGISYQSNTLITAIGQLHHASTPDFKGAASFNGPKWHSAHWDHTIDLTDKRIGVIGNAASAVQFIPEIAKTARQVMVFQRSANWMLPKQDRVYKEWEKKLVARIPFLLKIYRLKIWLLGGALYFLMSRGNQWMRRAYQVKTIRFIKAHIKDPALIKQLIPNYPMGAKRVLFSDTYYPALAKPNVQLISKPIASIRPNGIQCIDDTEHTFDILIYATGFKTNPFLMNLDIKGQDGTTIKEHWKEAPKTYLGITTDRFPNFFMMYGPNTNLGHNSIIVMSEAQAGYIAQGICAMKKNNWKTVDVKKKKLNEYYLSTQNRLKNMIWGTVENSWYKSASGNIPNNYPGRTMEYMRLTKKFRPNDYHIR